MNGEIQSVPITTLAGIASLTDCKYCPTILLFHHFNKRQSMSRIPVLLRSSGRRESSKALLSFVICGWTLKREVVVQSFSINIYFCALSRIAYIYFLQRQVSTLYVINTTIYGRYKTLQIRKLCCRKKESSLLLIAAPQ